MTLKKYWCDDTCTYGAKFLEEDRSYITDEGKFTLYNKLKNFLVTEPWNYNNLPKFCDRFLKRSFHDKYYVKWSPRLTKETRRLTYEEFCVWYEI